LNSCTATARSVVPGGALPDMLTDARKRAILRLRQAEEQVAYGLG
jgi:hypothetical protein